MGEKKAEVPVGKELVRMTGIMKEFPGVKALDNVKPVSYTHLDVYKRQVYTIIGIGTVFLVLIFISILISCFKYIHAWEEGKKKAAAPAPKAAPAPAVKPAAAPAVTGPDLSDDAELVAVMTAAIAAYEGSATSNLSLIHI